MVNLFFFFSLSKHSEFLHCVIRNHVWCVSPIVLWVNIQGVKGNPRLQKYWFHLSSFASLREFVFTCRKVQLMCKLKEGGRTALLLFLAFTFFFFFFTIQPFRESLMASWEMNEWEKQIQEMCVRGVRGLEGSVEDECGKEEPRFDGICQVWWCDEQQSGESGELTVRFPVRSQRLCCSKTAIHKHTNKPHTVSRLTFTCIHLYSLTQILTLSAEFHIRPMARALAHHLEHRTAEPGAADALCDNSLE